VATLTHHALVRWAGSFLSEEIRNKSTYRLLGDDIVIIGKDLAQTYVKLLTSLGIPFSKDKELIANDSSLEFCKKLYRKGVNITPLSWKILANKDPILRIVETTRVLLHQYSISKIESYTLQG